MPTVKIVEVDHVVVSMPPPEDLVIRLSALDAPWVTNPLIQRVLLFEFDDAGGQQHPPFDSLVGSLRASLAATLARLPPLAGRIVFLPSTGDAAIDCSGREGGGGVRFVVAESDDADARRLAGDADHDVATFEALVPKLEVDALPAEVLAVQVTRLKGGVAVGVALHHAVVDGRSVWMFLQAWAAACRGDDDVVAAVTFDRAVVAIPGGEELARSTLRKYAPNLPLAANLFPSAPIKLPRRACTITAKHIHHLKHRMSGQMTSGETAATSTLSSFVAIAALAWASFVRSKHPAAISSDHDVYLFFFIDCRGRPGIDPPVSENYFGTCITECLVKAMARDLLAIDGIAAAAAVIQREVRRAADDPLGLWDWMDIVSWVPLDRVVGINGSTRFKAYEVADFRWGAPSRTELVTMTDGRVVLVATKSGGVQASVCMHPDHVRSFNSHFLDSLG